MSSTNTSKSKAATLAQLQAFISGLQKQFPSGQFTLENTSFTTATLVQALQSLIDAINGATAAQASAKVAVTNKKAVVVKVGPIALALKRNLQTMFGSAADTLALFDLAPRKAPASRTSTEKAASAAKAKSTRNARGTMGSKQKLTVKGNVTGVTVTPITEPTAPAPSAQLASATPTAPSPGTAK